MQGVGPIRHHAGGIERTGAHGAEKGSMTEATKKGRKATRRNPVRDFINAHPDRGVSIADIAAGTGMSHQAADYAMCYLCKIGDAARIRQGKKRLYFATQAMADDYEKKHPYVPPVINYRKSGQNPERKARIAEYIKKNPGVAAADVSRGVNITVDAVRGMLLDMRSDGQAFSAGASKKPRWYGSLEAMRKAEGFIMAPAVKKVVQEKAPAIIVGMESAKVTPAVRKPDHRYVVSNDYRGEFSSLGIGRYVE